MLHTCRICLRSNPEITKNVSDFAGIIQKIAQIEVSPCIKEWDIISHNFLVRSSY